jgi:hypothetical protein
MINNIDEKIKIEDDELSNVTGGVAADRAILNGGPNRGADHALMSGQSPKGQSLIKTNSPSGPRPKGTLC